MQQMMPHNEPSKALTQRRFPREMGPVPPEPASRDAVGLNDLVRLLREHWGFVLLAGVLTFVAVLAITAASFMTFKATGQLYLGELENEKRPQATAPEAIELSGKTQGDVWSEIEIITSNALVTRAILASGLNVEIVPAGTAPLRYLDWRLARRDSRLLDAGRRELGVRDATLVEEMREPVSLHVRFTTPDEYVLSEAGRELGRGRLGAPLTAGRARLTLVAGSDRAPVVGRDYELRVAPLADVYASTAKELAVSVPKAGSTPEPAKVVTLAFSAGSPRAASDFLSSLMRLYLEQRQSWKTDEASASETFVTEQLASVRAALDKIQDELAEYRRANPGVVLDSEAKALIEQVGKYEEQRVAARLDVVALSQVQKAVRNPNAPLGAYLFGEARDTVLAGLAESLSEARQKLTDLDAAYNSAAPEVKRQRAQVESQREAIGAYVTSRLARAERMESEINGVIGQFQSRLKRVPGAEVGLARLTRESEVYSRLYSSLLERQQQIAILKASAISKNHVLDTPVPPLREESPKLALRLASGPLGLFLGVLALIARAVFTSSFQNVEELARAMAQVPVWGRVPKKRLRRQRRAVAGTRIFDLPFEPPEPEFDEAFRTLRTNLYHAGLGNGRVVVLVTSPSPGDGKTTVALSLAALLAADRRTTLVVDVDLRRPTYCIGHDEPSLETVLRGECTWRDAVHRISTSHGEIDAIGATAPCSPELLSSERLLAFLIEANDRYDVVVLDAASFPLVSDAAVLARHADCVLSVVALERTSRRKTFEHVRALGTLGVLQAVVANRAPRESLERATPAHAQLPPGPHAPIRLQRRARALGESA